jgi:predicted ArsR family transcriptional regulator
MNQPRQEQNQGNEDTFDTSEVDEIEKDPPANQHTLWTFLSNHAHVLVCLDRASDIRVREIAAQVGITERGVHRILSELEQGGLIIKHREGRRNHYEIVRDQPLRHSLERHASVGQLLTVLSRQVEQ